MIHNARETAKRFIDLIQTSVSDISSQLWYLYLIFFMLLSTKPFSKNFQRLVLYNLSVIDAKEQSRIVLRCPKRHLDLSTNMSRDLSKGPCYFVYTCNRHRAYCGCFRNSSTLPFPHCRFMLRCCNGKRETSSSATLNDL